MTPVDAFGKKGGRLKASLADPELVPLLREAIRDQTAGSPVDPNVMWTNRSPAELADELTAKKHPVDRKTVKRLLKEELGLSRRQMVKTLAMGKSADRDAQFRRLQKLKAEFFSKNVF